MNNWQKNLLDNLPDEVKHQLLLQDSHEIPKTEDQLHDFIKAYLGYSVPRVSVCKNHTNHFQLISDVFFGHQRNAIAFANRGGGKTISVAMICHLLSVLFPLYQIAVVAAERHQANRCYEYIKEFSGADNQWFAMDRVYSTLSKTVFRNGSNIEILTGTLGGCKSAHPVAVVLDEVEIMDWQIIQESFMMPMSQRDYEKVQILMSTRQFPTGNMFKLLVEKPKEPSWTFRTYPWCCFESCQKCTLPSCDPCKEKLRLGAQGKLESWYDICHEEPERHPDGKCRASDGFIRLEDLWDLFCTTDYDQFDTQQRCLTPGRKGLVFDTFDPIIHCKEEEIAEWWARLREDRKEEPERRHLKIAVIIDEGWAAPLAVLFIAKDGRDNMFLFDSIYETRLDLRDLVNMVQKRFQEYNIPFDFECRCDEKAPRVIDDLQKLGLNITPVGLPQDEQVSFIRQWLNGNYREGYPGVWIDPEKCYPLTVELETLKYKLDKDGEPRSELPDKGPDHLVNCWGYSFVHFGIAGGTLEIKVHRAEEPPNKPPQVPTRSDWAMRRSV